MTTNNLQDISTLLEQGAKLEAVKLQKLTTVSFQVVLTFSIGKEEDKLKPCPFCGKVPSVNQSAISELWHVMCDHCGASSTGKTTCAEAIEAWNRRESDGCAD